MNQKAARFSERYSGTGDRVCAAVALLLTVCASQSGTFSFSNTDPIVINDIGNPPTPASPYASAIEVTGLEGQVITHVSVTLNGFSHTFPSDVNILLVGPSGQMSTLMSEVGGNTRLPVSDLTLTLDSSAASWLPIDSELFSGVFKPTRQFPSLPFEFPAPAPAGSSSALADLSVFEGTAPDGAWRLFVLDESTPDSGFISSGWTLNLATPVPEPSTAALLMCAIGTLAFFRSKPN